MRMLFITLLTIGLSACQWSDIEDAVGVGAKATADANEGVVDFISGSKCLNQREAALREFTPWLDAQLEDGLDTMTLIEPYFIAIRAELAAAEPSELQLDVMTNLIATNVILRMATVVYNHPYTRGEFDDLTALSTADLATYGFQNLTELGFDTLGMRTTVASTPC